jgi:hypothetical protein
VLRAFHRHAYLDDADFVLDEVAPASAGRDEMHAAQSYA